MEISAQLLDDHRLLPKTSGVYLFLDQQDYPLYIGKSVNLRNRVSSYLRDTVSNQDERIQRMVHEAKSLRHIVTETELLALLLEDALIKKYLPVYNIKQKQFRDYRYVYLSEDRFPRLVTINDPGGVRTSIYGPFRDKYFIERLQQIFARYFGFRSCTEAEPDSSCIELDMGQCLGPCVLTEVHNSYAEISSRVAQFLKGQDPGVMNRIENDIKRSINELRFEHAQRLRDDLIFCDSFFNRQRFNHRFRIEYLKVKGRGAGTPKYLFKNGALQEVLLRDGRICRVGEQIDLFDLSVVKEDDPRFLLDRANLVFNWLLQNHANVEYEFQNQA